MRSGRIVAIRSGAELFLRATGLITFPLLARRAGADGYGAYSQINNVVAFLVPFASLGLSSAMVRFFGPRRWDASARRDVRRIVLWVLAASSALAIVMALAAPVLNEAILDWPDGTALFRAGAALIIVGAVEQLALNLLWARDRLVLYSSYQVAQGVVLIVALALTLRGPGDLVRALIALTIGRGGLACAAIVIGAAGAPSRSPDSEPAEPVAIAPMIRYGLPVAISSFGLWIINLADRIIIGGFRDAADLGRYGSVYTMAGLVTIVTAPFYLLALGRLMRATQAGDHDIVERDLRLLHRYISIGAVGACVALVVLIHPAVGIIGGEGFTASYWLIGMIVGGLFLDQWNGLAHYVLLCNDRTTFVQNAWLSAGAFNVVTNLVAVPRYGIAGAAAMTLLTFFVLNATLFMAARQYAPLERTHRWMTSGKSAVAAIVAALATHPILGEATTVAPLVVGAALFSVIYVVSLALMAEVTSGDVAAVRAIVRQPSDPTAVGPA